LHKKSPLWRRANTRGGKGGMKGNLVIIITYFFEDSRYSKSQRFSWSHELRQIFTTFFAIII
jgi:hypothetical protein